jgi:hypothetical protein
MDDTNYVLVDKINEDVELKKAFEKLPFNITFEEFQKSVFILRDKKCNNFTSVWNYMYYSWELWGYASNVYTVYQYKDYIFYASKWLLLLL